MDYPISVPNIGLVGGKFVNEDPFTGTPGSLIPAQWGNAVTDEIVNVIEGAGLTPAEANVTQLLAAIRLINKQGRLIDTKTFTSSGTYTPSPGTRAIRIRLCGGGAGAGGAAATAAGQISFGTGGSSGSYAEGYFTTFPASMAVIVGSGGSGVTGANGTSGGSSSVGSLISVNGGSNGGMFGPVNAGSPIAALVAPTGISISGAYMSIPSQSASVALALTNTSGFSGGGASGPLGAGGSPLNAAGTGNVGRGYGAGGGGAISFASQPLASAGGNGTAGVVFIEEWT